MAEIRIAGKGGQGVVLAGVVLARAAALYENKNAIQTQSYGPEARGSASRCDVIISDTEINELTVTKPDIMVVLSQDAMDKYKEHAKRAAYLIVDSDLVAANTAELTGSLFRIPAMRIASELNAQFAVNMATLGAVAKITKIVSLESLEKSIADIVSKKNISLNIDAVRKGYQYDENI